tara:strand:- start:15912 stop:16979 length:1068 start_codon:yes stop_codon:yes gene_type:complete
MAKLGSAEVVIVLLVLTFLVGGALLALFKPNCDCVSNTPVVPEPPDMEVDVTIYSSEDVDSNAACNETKIDETGSTDPDPLGFAQPLIQFGFDFDTTTFKKVYAYWYYFTQEGRVIEFHLDDTLYAYTSPAENPHTRQPLAGFTQGYSILRGVSSTDTNSVIYANRMVVSPTYVSEEVEPSDSGPTTLTMKLGKKVTPFAPVVTAPSCAARDIVFGTLTIKAGSISTMTSAAWGPMPRTFVVVCATGPNADIEHQMLARAYQALIEGFSIQLIRQPSGAEWGGAKCIIRLKISDRNKHPLVYNLKTGDDVDNQGRWVFHVGNDDYKDDISRQFFASQKAGDGYTNLISTVKIQCA